MTQPLNKRADEGGRERSGAVEAGVRSPPFTAFQRRPPPFAALAASIPIAKRILPHPASQPGIPVARSIRASAYTMRDVPGDVSAHSATRASAVGRRRVASRARAASIPRP